MPYVDLNTIPNLTDPERSSIREHCALSGLIQRMEAIRAFLIEQVHEKRADCKRGRFKARDPLIEKLYRTVLFGGKRHLSSFSRFPSSFRCYLDDVLLQSVPLALDRNLGFSICNVYYNPKNVPLEELHASLHFNATEWELNDPAEDQATLRRFREEFIQALQHLTDSSKRLGLPARKMNVLKREVARYSRATE
jgi:hypothetical protein